MKISYNPAKRKKILAERGLDFEAAPKVFEGLILEFPDMRHDYGEERMITVGFLDNRMVIIIWTQRGDTRRIISMRKTNEKEQKRFRQRLI